MRIKDRNGRWLEEEEEIIVEFGVFYKELFLSNGDRNWGQVLSYVPKLVIDEMNRWLVRDIKDEEVKLVVFQLGAYKATGPDGYNGFFYQKYWETIKGDVIKVVQYYFRNRRLLREINMTYIILIPKIKAPKGVAQFRPISLCNFAYKAISKVIVNRLKPLLGELITENQSAFVAKRKINDKYSDSSRSVSLFKVEEEREEELYESEGGYAKSI